MPQRSIPTIPIDNLNLIADFGYQPRFKVGALVLLEPFLSQIWMSVRGLGRIMAVGAALLGLGSGIGGGGGG